ncbi:MAG: hypothetical protein ACTSQ4_02265 [Candidatus Heimdallarchaeaceae archaeon]
MEIKTFNEEDEKIIREYKNLKLKEFADKLKENIPEDYTAEEFRNRVDKLLEEAENPKWYKKKGLIYPRQYEKDDNKEFADKLKVDIRGRNKSYSGKWDEAIAMVISRIDKLLEDAEKDG